jgi:hypothetical protein
MQFCIIWSLGDLPPQPRYLLSKTSRSSGWIWRRCWRTWASRFSKRPMPTRRSLLEFDPAITTVITDVDMPVTMDGLALTFVVRDRWPPCRLIVVSGHRRPNTSDMAVDSRFIRKPLTTGDLQRTLAELDVGT